MSKQDYPYTPGTGPSERDIREMFGQSKREEADKLIAADRVAKDHSPSCLYCAVNPGHMGREKLPGKFSYTRSVSAEVVLSALGGMSVDTRPDFAMVGPDERFIVGGWACSKDCMDSLDNTPSGKLVMKVACSSDRHSWAVLRIQDTTAGPALSPLPNKGHEEPEAFYNPGFFARDIHRVHGYVWESLCELHPGLEYGAIRLTSPLELLLLSAGHCLKGVDIDPQGSFMWFSQMAQKHWAAVSWVTNPEMEGLAGENCSWLVPTLRMFPVANVGDALTAAYSLAGSDPGVIQMDRLTILNGPESPMALRSSHDVIGAGLAVCLSRMGPSESLTDKNLLAVAGAGVSMAQRIIRGWALMRGHGHVRECFRKLAEVDGPDARRDAHLQKAEELLAQSTAAMSFGGSMDTAEGFLASAKVIVDTDWILDGGQDRWKAHERKEAPAREAVAKARKAKEDAKSKRKRKAEKRKAKAEEARQVKEMERQMAAALKAQGLEMKGRVIKDREGNERGGMWSVTGDTVGFMPFPVDYADSGLAGF